MKKLSFLLLVIVLVSASCSKKRYVTMNTLRPAEISLPKDINSIVIVDRSKFEKDAVNIIEGVLTGELPGQDKAAIQHAMNSLKDNLLRSPRYRVVVATERYNGNSVTAAFPDALSWGTVNRICNQYNADAVLAFEIFDSDFIVTDGKRKVKKTVGEGDNKREVEVDEFFAQGVGNLKMGIRLYDLKGREVIDQKLFNDTNTWEAAADSKAGAVAALVDRVNATNYLSSRIASGYAYKIAPMPVQIKRPFYSKSKKVPEVEIGSRKADVGDWQGAIDTWKKGISKAEIKEKGYLTYNIAIAYEVLGKYDNAIKWAQKSFVDYGLKDARDYVRQLENRKRQEQQVDNQLN